MPYLRCNACGVVSYAPAGARGACPECGVPWPRRADEVVRSADPEHRLGALMRMARNLLDVDLAMVTRISGGRETIEVVAGGWSDFTPRAGESLPVEDTFCQLMLEGRIAHAVPDARHDPETAELELVRGHGAGAYLGVPIRPGNAELYVLCCLAREARPSLGAREIRLMSGLAESVSAELRTRSQLRARAEPPVLAAERSEL